MGTERYLSWSTWERSADAADAARDDGYTVVGLELADDAVPLHQLRPGPDVCLALGHEDHGLSPATLAACDTVAFLPQLGRVGSLNVATAAAIAIYELRRQGWALSGPRTRPGRRLVQNRTGSTATRSRPAGGGRRPGRRPGRRCPAP